VLRLLVMGTPGAGKGTQAKLLAGRFGACHISTGDVLREAVRGRSKLGREAKRYMDQGLLVPDDVVIGIVAERLEAGDCKGGFLLDGFPRTVAQAQALDALLASRGQPLDGVLLIAVPREDALKRLAGRRVCEKCATMFHLTFEPPAEAGRCDRCGGPLVQRADDREETIRHRMEIYTRETAPVLEHYRKAGILREIDGTGSREDVFGRVAASVE
jgi:adenylate kinase